MTIIGPTLTPRRITRTPTVWPRERAPATYDQCQRGMGTPHPPVEIFTPDTVGGDISFQALLFDGIIDLERPGVAVYANQESTPLIRALTCQLPMVPGIAIGRASAAWVHTAKYPPQEVNILYEQGYSIPAVAASAQFARSILPVQDLIEFGAVRVTTPLRTVMDLAAWYPVPQARQHIMEFPNAGELISAAIVELNGRYNFRNKVPALKTLSELASWV